jgi:hypothetical protein
MLTTKFAVFFTEAGEHLDRYSVFKFNHFTNRIDNVPITCPLHIDANEPYLDANPITVETSCGRVSTYYWKTGFNLRSENEIIPVYDFINRSFVIPDVGRLTCIGDYSEWCKLRIREQFDNHKIMLSITGCSEIIPVTAPKEKGIPQFVALALKKAGVDTGAECMISLTALKDCERVSVTNCYHCFDTDSLNSWCKNKNNCPMCKADITSVTIV